jgi:Bacteriophage lambda head decoration protein D
MTVLTQNLRQTAHYIVSEAHGYRSRDTGVIASGSGVVQPGAVLGKVTATGKYEPLAPGASDGTQTPAAILYEGCDATSQDVRRTLTVRDTEVQADVLVWAAGVTDLQKTAALAALAALGIVAR